MPSRKKPRHVARSVSRCSRPRLEWLEDRTLLASPGQLFPNPTAIVPPPGVSFGQAVTGDFNRDGHEDFAVSCPGNNDLLIYLGNGDGTFKSPISYSIGTYGSIATGDFTGNGILDIAMEVAGGGAILVLLGNGDGTFRSPVSYSAPVLSQNIVVGDFTGNGKLDIACSSTDAGPSSGSVTVLLGNGDGTFQMPITTTYAGLFPAELVAGDFTGDGRSDLAVCGTGNQQVAILPSNGDGTFGTPIPVPSSPYNNVAIAAADLTGDGHLDLITGDPNGAPITTTGQIHVWFGDGHGNFTGPTTYSVPANPDSIVVADLNGDAKPDLIVGDGNDSAVSVLMNQGGGSFASPVTYNLPTNPGVNAIAVADFHGDQRPDILFTTTTGALLTNNRDGTFDDSTQTITDPNHTPVGIAAGDLNGDGLPDIVTSQPSDATISVLINNGQGGFDLPVSYSTDTGTDPALPNNAIGSEQIALADLTGNGILDVVVPDFGTNKISVFMGNGDGTFAAAINLTSGGMDPLLVACGDLTGNGREDIVALDYGSADISVFLSNADGTFSGPVVYKDSTNTGPGGANGLILTDLTGDGKLDAIVDDGGVFVLPGHGDGTFGAPILVPLVPGQTFGGTGIAAGQFTSDGRMDLVTSQDGYDGVFVLLNQGHYQFQAHEIPLGFEPGPPVVGDFNGDGKLDVAVGGGIGSQITLLQGNGDGTFGSPVQYDAGPWCDNLAVADFNGDGRSDIAASDEFESSDEITALESSPAVKSSTVTEAENASIPFSKMAQSVTLSATVTSSGAGVNEGTVTFSIFQGSTQVGASATSGILNNGAASATYTLPAGQAAGTYTIQAVYNPGPDYHGSSDSTHTLTVTPSTAATTTVATNASASFSLAPQPVTLSATVTSGGVGVSEGTVTFSVFEGSTQVGASVTSGTVSGGAASAVYTLPAGQAAGTYTIQAVYNPGADYQTSSDNSHTLSVGGDATSTTVAMASTTFSASSQSVMLTASVTSSSTTVDEGTVTFTVRNNGMTVGTPVVASVSGGSASMGYTLPAALAAGSYSILARYSDSSGNFLASDNSADLGSLVVAPAGDDDGRYASRSAFQHVGSNGDVEGAGHQSGGNRQWRHGDIHRFERRQPDRQPGDQPGRCRRRCQRQFHGTGWNSRRHVHHPSGLQRHDRLPGQFAGDEHPDGGQRTRDGSDRRHERD